MTAEKVIQGGLKKMQITLHVLFTQLPFPVNQNWICEQIALSSFSNNVMFCYIVLVFTSSNACRWDEVFHQKQVKRKINVSLFKKDHWFNAEIHLLHLIILSKAEVRLQLTVHGYRVPWQYFAILWQLQITWANQCFKCHLEKPQQFS